MIRFNNMSRALFLAVLLVGLVSCGPNSKVAEVRLIGETQGTTYNIVYHGTDVNLKREVDSLLSRFDMDLSQWEPESIISRFNKWERIDTVFAFYDSTKFISVTYELAREVHLRTNGAFNPAIGPLVELWGFGLKKRGEVTPDMVAELMPLIDFGHQNVDFMELYVIHVYQETWLSKGKPGVRLDFNGLAQGVAVDFVSELLDKHGIENYMVEIGGEVYCRGLNARGTPWHIAIEEPLDNGDRSIRSIVGVSNAAIATSGSYRKFYEEDGKRYSHTIHPGTGYPVSHQLLSATVVSITAGFADAYATALMVMGPDGAKQFCENAPSEIKGVYLIYELDGELQTWMTESMRQMIVSEEL
jgi:FAD:protein FMN transferase